MLIAAIAIFIGLTLPCVLLVIWLLIDVVNALPKAWRDRDYITLIVGLWTSVICVSGLGVGLFANYMLATHGRFS